MNPLVDFVEMSIFLFFKTNIFFKHGKARKQVLQKKLKKIFSVNNNSMRTGIKKKFQILQQLPLGTLFEKFHNVRMSTFKNQQFIQLNKLNPSEKKNISKNTNPSYFA